MKEDMLRAKCMNHDSVADKFCSESFNKPNLILKVNSPMRDAVTLCLILRVGLP